MRATGFSKAELRSATGRNCGNLEERDTIRVSGVLVVCMHIFPVFPRGMIAVSYSPIPLFSTRCKQSIEEHVRSNC